MAMLNNQWVIGGYGLASWTSALVPIPRKRFNNDVRTVDAAGPSSAVDSLQQVAQLPAWLFPIAHVKRKCGKSLHVGGASAAGCKQPLQQTEPKHSMNKKYHCEEGKENDPNDHQKGILWNSWFQDSVDLLFLPPSERLDVATSIVRREQRVTRLVVSYDLLFTAPPRLDLDRF